MELVPDSGEMIESFTYHPMRHGTRGAQPSRGVRNRHGTPSFCSGVLESGYKRKEVRGHESSMGKDSIDIKYNYNASTAFVF